MCSGCLSGFGIYSASCSHLDCLTCAQPGRAPAFLTTRTPPAREGRPLLLLCETGAGALVMLGVDGVSTLQTALLNRPS